MNRASVRVADSWTGTAWVLDYEAAHSMTVAIFDEAVRAMPRPEAPGADDILAIARTLIARPERWAQAPSPSTGKGGRSPPSTADAASAPPALSASRPEVLGGDEAARRRIGPEVDRAGRLLDSAAFKLGEFESYVGLNEHDTHAHVVAMFDHALGMAHADAAPGPEASRS